MKRIVTFVSLFAFAAAAANAAPAPSAAKKAHAKPAASHVAHAKYRVAPADEYFGRLKMSILGIRNSLRDMGLKADMDPLHAASIMGTVRLTEDAMHDWERKYPRDGWIPGAILSLERVYAKVDTDDARSRAKRTMAWLVHDYPRSAQGRLGRQELAQNRVGVRPSPKPSVAPPVLDTAVSEPKP